MEWKTRSIRADAETLEHFKVISEEFDNQGLALESLINAYEIQKAKGTITNMQTDIEDFDAHLDSLQKVYLHALQLNQNAESRARLEFQQQLESKDRQIADLQQCVCDADLALKKGKAETAALRTTLDRQAATDAERVAVLEERLSNANGKVTALEATVSDKDTIIDSLKRQLADATANPDLAEASSKSVDELRAQLNALRSSLTASQAETASLKERLAKQVEESQERAKLAQERAELDTQRAVLAERSKAQDKIESLTQHVGELMQQNSELTHQVSELNVRIGTLSV